MLCFAADNAQQLPSVENQSASAASSANKTTKSGDKMAAARRNVFRTLLTVTVCFVLCWISNSVYVLIYLSGGNVKLAGPFYVLTVYAALGNCIINPFIYCIQYKPFQREALRLVRGRILGRPDAVGFPDTSFTSQAPTISPSYDQ